MQIQLQNQYKSNSQHQVNMQDVKFAELSHHARCEQEDTYRYSADPHEFIAPKYLVQFSAAFFIQTTTTPSCVQSALKMLGLHMV